MAVFGGTPLIAAFLIDETGNLTAPSWYLTAVPSLANRCKAS